jgi:cell wall-associated NlpC family hydrolase
VPAPRTSARPAPSARELHALREALASGRPLTVEQAAVLRAAASAARTAAGTRNRTTGTGGPRKKAPARKNAARKKTARTPATRTERSGDRSRWSTRIGVVATSAVLVPALATIALTGPQEPGTAGPGDATALALTAQTTLLEHADRYRELQQDVDRARASLTEARAAEQVALARVDAQQDEVGARAADLYRAAPQSRYPLLALDTNDPAATDDVLFQQAVAERAAEELRGAVVRAERAAAALAAATGRIAATESAVEAAGERATVVLASARDTVDGLSTEVSLQLAALGTVPVPGPQQERNDQAMRRWQDYLSRLAAAGIEPPAAADLRDLADFPMGFSPALDADGRPMTGVAWAIEGTRPMTVVPAETVAAVSTALSQLGKPFAPGTAGPDSYDCGGFTSATWLLAGYALPATPQEQWAAGTPVAPEHLQFGDLVFAPGGQDVGIYLGEGDVLGASAATYSVAVRPLTAGSSAVRVTLPAPAKPNAALAGVGPAGPCGAPLPEPGPATPQWGGWSNGQIPSGALCELGVYRHALRCDAAASYKALSAAYQAEFGHPMCITDSYRSLGAQVAAFYAKPALAAVPGTSNHGWALAVDLCDGVNVFGTPQWTWMTQHAGRFGFVQPAWAGPGGKKPEPWHWEYGYIS